MTQVKLVGQALGSALHNKIARWAGSAFFAATLATAQQAVPVPDGSHENLNSVLWSQTAVEHEALCRQAYRQAADLLPRALKDRRWTAALEQRDKYSRLPPAVILDIDETVLDNAPAQARDVLADREFTLTDWRAWVEEAAAPALLGAVEFTREAYRRGVMVFFVTNRDAAEEPATRRNLERLGFPLDATIDTVLTRGEKPEWTSDKGTRRQEIARLYRILFLIGDDLGDFISGARSSTDARTALVQPHSDRWGRQWIVLPNPMYGSWEAALLDPADTSREARLSRKRARLRRQ